MSTRRRRKRGTTVIERVGTPSLFSTTTPEVKISPDDLNRVSVAHTDLSPEQNLAIAKARAKGPNRVNREDLPVWQKAMSLLCCAPDDFKNPPDWLQYVAEHLPTDVRVRRDWPRALAFCSAVALCRQYRSLRPLNIEFADYCVAYRVLEPVFGSTIHGFASQALEVTKAAARLNVRLKRSVTFRQIAHELRWSTKTVNKHAQEAREMGLIEYEPGTREKNVKLVRARSDMGNRFLPSPRNVLSHNPEIGRKIKYIDPFTGKWKVVKR